MSSNTVWQNLKISRDDRQKLKGHKSFCLWFTGISGSGKSTIADGVEQKLHQMGVHTYLLDGDNIRKGLNSDLGFSDSDRVENIRRISEVASLFADAGIAVVTSFISPFKSEREFARSKFPKGEFVEVFVDCPLEVCESRDVKGLYKKARNGEIKAFTGIDSPYEKPESPELIIASHKEGIEESVNKIIDYLTKKNMIK